MSLDAQVLIIGAGPVGLTMAMDLAQRGVPVTVLEQRRFGEPPSVKCNHVSSRTMEQFRRLGVAAKLRGAGLPEDYPNDVVFRTSMTGMELTRIPIPCRRDRYTATEGPDTWWPTAEPPHRINQIYLEPILLEHAASLPGVSLMNRTELMGFEQEGETVKVTTRNLDTGQEKVLSVRYLIGCDGGSSMVRKLMGSRLEGTAVIQRVQSTYIHAPGLKALLPGESAWCYYAVNPRRCGTVFAIDGEEKWLVHNHLHPDEPEFDSVDRDASIRHILGVGEDFQYSVLSREDWVGRRLVADRFRNGNVFIAGDAAHLWVPYAGYGMNAGIADALNLSWLLAARVQGWAEESILDAYEIERQPITEQVSHFVMNHAQKMIKARRAVPPNIEDLDTEGEAARALIGQEAYELNVQQFCCAGLNFGYFYQGSPIIAYDDETAPGYTMGGFTPSTVPGCRVPHFFLADGQSLYDVLGSGYTLMRFDPGIDVSALMSEAKKWRVPLALLDLHDQPECPDVYRHALVMCRSDQHIVWRGQQLPPDLPALLTMLRGAAVAGKSGTSEQTGRLSLAH